LFHGVWCYCTPPQLRPALPAGCCIAPLGSCSCPCAAPGFEPAVLVEPPSFSTAHVTFKRCLCHSGRHGGARCACGCPQVSLSLSLPVPPVLAPHVWHRVDFAQRPAPLFAATLSVEHSVLRALCEHDIPLEGLSVPSPGVAKQLAITRCRVGAVVNSMRSWSEQVRTAVASCLYLLASHASHEQRGFQKARVRPEP